MDTKRKVALALLGVVLFAAVLSANLVVAADRTVLDAGFAKDTAEESGLYESITDEIRGSLAGEFEPVEQRASLERSAEGIVEDAVTEEYVQSQIEANVDRTYEYLHGESDEFRVEVDVAPVKEDVVAELDGAIGGVDLAAFDVPRAGEIQAMADSEAEFDRQREGFREDAKARIQAETDEELSDEQLERRLDENMGAIREDLHERRQAELDGAFDDGVEAAVEEPARDVSAARVDALTGELTYEEYVQRFETAEEDARDAVVASFETRLDEAVPDAVDLTGEMDDDARETVETARTAVSLAGTLVYVLPVVALAAAGLVAWLAPASLAATVVGGVAALVGVLGVVGAQVALDRVETALAVAGDSSGTTEFVANAAAGALGTLTVQSTVLLVVGIALVAVGMAIRRDLLPADFD